MASVGLLAAATAASAQNTVFLLLQVGNQTIKGESKISGFFSDDAIEVLGINFDFTGGSAATGPGRAAGRPTFSRLTFRKRFDTTSPWIMRGLFTGERAAAYFHFYRPSEKNPNELEVWQTISLSTAKIDSVRMVTEKGANGQPEYFEEVGFVFDNIFFTLQPSGAGSGYSLPIGTHTEPTPTTAPRPTGGSTIPRPRVPLPRP